MPKETLPNLYAINVEKESVLSGDVDTLIGKIKQIEVTNRFTNGSSLFNSVAIMFDGYDHVLDEVFEIKEIRAYVQKLFSKFPELFYYINEETGSITPVLLCLADETVRKSTTQKEFKDSFSKPVQMNIFASFKGHVYENIHSGIASKTANTSEKVKGAMRSELLEQMLRQF